MRRSVPALTALAILGGCVGIWSCRTIASKSLLSDLDRRMADAFAKAPKDWNSVEVTLPLGTTGNLILASPYAINPFETDTGIAKRYGKSLTKTLGDYCSLDSSWHMFHVQGDGLRAYRPWVPPFGFNAVYDVKLDGAKAIVISRNKAGVTVEAR